MTSIVDFNKIAELDLEQIKVKLMHASGEGWTRAQADLVEIEYRRFLYLALAFPLEQASPRVDVDTFWHYHILDTAKYAADCEQAFGFFLHHNPSVALSGEGAEEEHEAGGERMRALYEATFGISYDRAATGAYCSVDSHCTVAPPPTTQASSDTAYCSIDVPPAIRAKADTASCSIDVPPAVRAQGAIAYCSIDLPPAIRAKGDTAYWSIDLPPQVGARAARAVAYCSIHPPTGRHGGSGGERC